MRDRPDYGIDAPRALAGYVALGVILLGLGIAFTVLGTRAFGARLLRQGVWMGPVLLLGGAFHLWGSKVGKVREAARLIDAIPWKGDERVLDVGCGRGLLLIEAAGRVPGGRAVGIDIWSAKDQSGNRPEATRHNAELAAVSDRVDVLDGDARALPFPDASFDVVVSSAVLHNLHDRAGRRRALREIVRVLRPGRGLAILDILHTGQYAHELAALGMDEVALSAPRPLWLFPARTVTAEKPRD
ncbi:MAG TPA: class I SAM-dependent methyltransferase [Actinomycetota bacterium]|nr:class I SAM-dependent methyltransferase [Actinomycetota bacterium]